MSTPPSFNDALKLLRDKYRQDLPSKLADIERLLEIVRNAKIFAAEQAHTLHRMVHGLSGSGATFGLSGLSNAAKVLEESLKEVIENAVVPTGEVAVRLGLQWDALRQVAKKTDEEVALEGQEIAPLVRTGLHVKKDDGYILLVDDDVEQARNIELQLGHFGYKVRVLHDTAQLNDAVAEKAPAVIIMDVLFPEGNMDGPQAINGLPDEIKGRIPVIFVSSRADVNARLSAVRAGAVAYFTKPVDMGALVDTLDERTSENLLEGGKVLVVDDSPALASYYAMILKSAGMDVVIVTDPLKVLDVISEFTPELILMDMYMPGCSGLEMAQIIRQQEAYVSTPIVFLSAETDIEKQLQALQFGADDFLTKPIQPAHLVSSVTARIQRYRILRSFMIKDSLTGLLNHVKTKEELALEIMRAQRQKNSLVFAMIDIDFFKKVNDNYGHPTGDRVIKSLSRLLQQRLRKSDVVGRYGGEEFAVILKDTNAASAYATLDNIRKAFEQIVQHSEKGDFSVTFSSGMAEFPAYGSAAEINNAADKALYEAKHAGRNRVVIAQAPGK